MPFVVDITTGPVYLRLPSTFPHRNYDVDSNRSLDPNIGSGAHRLTRPNIQDMARTDICIGAGW